MNECAEMHARAVGMARESHPGAIACILGACFIFATALALVPFDVDVRDYKFEPLHPEKVLNPANYVNIEKSEAHAYSEDPYAMSFLEACSSAAGLSVNDFITAVATSYAINSGVAITSSETQYGATGEDSALYKLRTNNKWPEYSELPESLYEIYQTEGDYMAALFNSLLDAFDLGTARDEWYSSGGGDLDDDSISICEAIGDVASQWSNGVKVLGSQIKSLMPSINQDLLNVTYMKSTLDEYLVNYWPIGYTTRIYTSAGFYFEKPVKNRNNDKDIQTYWKFTADHIVYMAVFKSSERGLKWIIASPSPFKYSQTGSNPPNQNPSTNTHDEKTVYWASGSYGGITNYYWIAGAGNVEFNPYTYEDNDANRSKIAWSMVYGRVEPTPLIPEFPGLPPDNIEFPEQYGGSNGFNPNMNWNQYFSNEPGQPINPDPDDPDPDDPDPDDPDPDTTRPDNPYNPQNPDPETGEPTTGTGTPEWREETEDNVIPLMDIRFDNLFPFSMLFDISKLFNKVDSMTQTESGSGVYNSLTIPFIWSDNSNDAIVLDLTALHDLLLMVRIFNQLLLGAFLLFTCIEFWRGILTG